VAIGPITPEIDPPALGTAERFIRTQDGESYYTDSRYVVVDMEV
jgi:hypothetical protein